MPSLKARCDPHEETLWPEGLTAIPRPPSWAWRSSSEPAGGNNYTARLKLLFCVGEPADGTYLLFQYVDLKKGVGGMSYVSSLEFGAPKNGSTFGLPIKG